MVNFWICEAEKRKIWSGIQPMEANFKNSALMVPNRLKFSALRKNGNFGDEKLD